MHELDLTMEASKRPSAPWRCVLRIAITYSLADIPGRRSPLSRHVWLAPPRLQVVCRSWTTRLIVCRHTSLSPTLNKLSIHSATDSITQILLLAFSKSFG